MRLPSYSNDENATTSCFAHMVEDRNLLKSCCRESGASPTAGHNETGKQAAKNSNDGSTILGLVFPNWTPWRKSLVIVKPDTAVRWHRKGFKLFWKFKSRGSGRPRTDREIRKLVRKMAAANPDWGAPRIHGELLRLGFEVSERTVSNLMPRRPPNSKPSQTWRTFLNNHANKCSIDFFTVPTVAFNILFVLVILCHSRRKVVHFNVTSNPTAQWTAQQVVEAYPWDTAPKYLMRDRDSIYGDFFRNQVKNMGIQEVISAPKKPWQNPFVERVIGSIRRECTDTMSSS